MPSVLNLNSCHLSKKPFLFAETACKHKHTLPLSFSFCGLQISVAHSTAWWPAKALGCGAGLTSSTFSASVMFMQKYPQGPSFQIIHSLSPLKISTVSHLWASESIVNSQPYQRCSSILHVGLAWPSQNHCWSARSHRLLLFNTT